MLHPSYTELMERINKDVEEGDTPIVQSRYSIVKATADRAKQIIASRAIGDKIAKQIKNEPLAEPVISDSQHLTMRKGNPLIKCDTDDMKPLSIAIEELYEGYVKISERSGNFDDEIYSDENEEQELESTDDSSLDKEAIEAQEKEQTEATEEVREEQNENDEDEASDASEIEEPDEASEKNEQDAESSEDEE